MGHLRSRFDVPPPRKDLAEVVGSAVRERLTLRGSPCVQSFSQRSCSRRRSLATGCAATVAADAYGPDLVTVSPGVQVIADYDEPIFYSDGFYWRYYGGVWYRSSYYTGGWVYARPPVAVLRIDWPHAYVHYRPRGLGGPSADRRSGACDAAGEARRRRPPTAAHRRRPAYRGARRPRLPAAHRRPRRPADRPPATRRHAPRPPGRPRVARPHHGGGWRGGPH